MIYRMNRRMYFASPLKRVVRAVPHVKRAAFDQVLDASLGRSPFASIDYRLPYPKAEFLNYVCDWKGYAVHGSPLTDLPFLSPVRRSVDITEFGNRQQVFCSPDAMWAMWFAILDKQRVQKTDNGCVCVGKGPGRVKFYHFDLPKDNAGAPPFADGMIYLVKAEDFPDRRTDPALDLLDAEVEEWGSTIQVIPLAKLRVTAEDFPYLNSVQYRL